VRIADFGRYRLAAVRAGGAQRRVGLGAQRASLNSHRAPRDVSYAWATLLPESASGTHVDGGSPLLGARCEAKTGSGGLYARVC
jgi:hypothetical protein